MIAKLGQEQRTAYHEAGHTVAHFWLSLGLKRVTIMPDDEAGSLGHVEQSRPANYRVPRERAFAL